MSKHIKQLVTILLAGMLAFGSTCGIVPAAVVPEDRWDAALEAPGTEGGMDIGNQPGDRYSVV